MSHALPEDELHAFLRRRRREAGFVEPPPLGSWLGETLDLAARLVPSEAGSLLLDDPSRGRGQSPLSFVAAFGAESEQLLGTAIPAGRGIVGRVYRTGATRVVEQPQQDPDYFPRVDGPSPFRARSLVAAPVRLEQAVCGVFELVNRQGRSSYSERDVELVELFARYVSRAILNAVDILKQNELAVHDELTGVRNVRALEPILDRTVRDAAEDADLAVVFADVDRLKAVNDRHGHRAGSETLRRTAAALEGAVEARGTVFRFGGDEFVILCPVANYDEAGALAERLREAVYAGTPGPWGEGGSLPAMSISVGVATLRTSLASGGPATAATTGARLLTAADNALYRAKRAGRARTCRATPDDDTLR